MFSPRQLDLIRGRRATTFVIKSLLHKSAEPAGIRPQAARAGSAVHAHCPPSRLQSGDMLIRCARLGVLAGRRWQEEPRRPRYIERSGRRDGDALNLRPKAGVKQQQAAWRGGQIAFHCTHLCAIHQVGDI